VTNLTQYTKNYTKIFKDWVESRTPVPDLRKKKSVQKSKKQQRDLDSLNLKIGETVWASWETRHAYLLPEDN